MARTPRTPEQNARYYENRRAKYPEDVAARRGHLSLTEALRDQVAHAKYLDEPRNLRRLRELRDSDQAKNANDEGMRNAKAAGEVPVDYLREAPRGKEHYQSQAFLSRKAALNEATKAQGYTYLIPQVSGKSVRWRVVYMPQSAASKARYAAKQRLKRRRGA